MSFLLLKSTRRSQQSGHEQQRSGSGNIRNSNSLPVATFIPKTSSRPASAFPANDHSSTPHRFSNNDSSVVTPLNRVANAGHGQVQLQRSSQNQYHKKLYDAHTQILTNQKSTDMQPTEVVSMEEVMEDLRILEQQQRDSQRQLQSVKLTKQHKLSQKEKLEQTLAALKYKNGQYKVQLSHARQVLSTSTRSLATVKLRADKASDNWKKFNESLKRSMDTIHSLHEKRRTVDDLLLKLREKESCCKKDTENQKSELESKLNELEDLKHTEQILVKAVQSAKLKLQESMEGTGKLRSELGELDLEMTETQQMEASMRMRVEGVRKDIENENSRHEHARLHHDTKMSGLLKTKEEILHQIEEMKKSCERNDQELSELFSRCVQAQKDLGHEPSASQREAKLDLDRVRNLAEEVKTKTYEDESRASQLVEKNKALEEDKAMYLQRNQLARSLVEELALENENRRTVQEIRCSDRKTFVAQLESSQQKVLELRNLEASCKKESKVLLESFDSKKAEVVGALKANKERLVELTVQSDDLREKHQNLILLLKNEKNECNQMTSAAKISSENARKDLENAQNRIDSLSTLPSIEDDESVKEMKQEAENQVSNLLSRQSKLILEYPCLAGIVISYDIAKSKKLRIDSALSEIRSSCEARIEACRAERQRRISAKQEEAKAQTLNQQRVHQKSLSNPESKKGISKRSSYSGSLKRHSSHKSYKEFPLQEFVSNNSDDLTAQSENICAQGMESKYEDVKRQRENRSSKRKKEPSFSYGSDSASVETEVRSILRHVNTTSAGSSILQKIPDAVDRNRTDSVLKDKDHKDIRKLKSLDSSSKQERNDNKDKRRSKCDPLSERNRNLHQKSLESREIHSQDVCISKPESTSRNKIKTFDDTDDGWTYDGTVSTTRSKVRFEDVKENPSFDNISSEEDFNPKRPSIITISSSTGNKQGKQISNAGYIDNSSLSFHDVNSAYFVPIKNQSFKKTLSKDHPNRFLSQKHVSEYIKLPNEDSTCSNNHLQDSSSTHRNPTSSEKKGVSKKEMIRSNSSIVREKMNALKRKDLMLSQNSSRRRKRSRQSGAGLSFNNDEDFGFLNN